MTTAMRRAVLRAEVGDQDQSSPNPSTEKEIWRSGPVPDLAGQGCRLGLLAVVGPLPGRRVFTPSAARAGRRAPGQMAGEIEGGPVMLHGEAELFQEGLPALGHVLAGPSSRLVTGRAQAGQAQGSAAAVWFKRSGMPSEDMGGLICLTWSTKM